MPDWRESLGAVLAEQAAAGRWLTPESHEELLDYLEAWWELASSAEYAGASSFDPASAEAQVEQPASALPTSTTPRVSKTKQRPVGRFRDRAPQNNYRVEGKRRFDAGVALMKRCMAEMEQILEAVAPRLEAAPAQQNVDIEAEADAIEDLIWRYRDAEESAREAWLAGYLPNDLLGEINAMPGPGKLRLPDYVDSDQQERMRVLSAKEGARLRGRSFQADLTVAGARTLEFLGTAAGVLIGAGVVITAAKKGGVWGVVKVIAIAGAADTAGDVAEHALLAAGVDETVMRGVQLAAAAVSLVIAHKKLRAASAERPRQPLVPVQREPMSHGRVRIHEPGKPQGPLKNRSGDLDRAAHAARTQSHAGGNTALRNTAPATDDATPDGLTRSDNPNRLMFEGTEVRAVRSLSHVDSGTLIAMRKYGFAARDRNGNRLDLHHLNQDPKAALVEIPKHRHRIANRVQHPHGNKRGSGLSSAERAAFYEFRTRYWQARAAEELSKRGVP